MSINEFKKIFVLYTGGNGMKLVFMIQHPAHVHFFKNIIKKLSKTQDIYVFVRDKEIITDLLKEYVINYTILSKKSSSSFIKTELIYEYEGWKAIKDISPDLIITIGGPTAAHIGKILDIPSIIFTDTEHAKLQNKITFPFANYIFTPNCYRINIGSKQIKYPGYHELAYLHPNRFEPDPSVLDYIDADKDDKIVVLRLISWQATHDIGHKGFADIKKVLSKFESKRCKVVITSEGDIPEEGEHCLYDIPPHKMHDLMYYSDLFIGEGGTMASESAVLGTPSILVSTLNAGVWNELEHKYGLLFHFNDYTKQEKSLEKAVSILNEYDRRKWIKKRKNMLKDKIDVTKFIIEQVNKVI